MVVEEFVFTARLSSYKEILTAEFGEYAEKGRCGSVGVKASLGSFRLICPFIRVRIRSFAANRVLSDFAALCEPECDEFNN